MPPLVFLLFPVVLAAGVELRIDSYVVAIDESTLTSIRKVEDSGSNALNLSNLGIRVIDKNAFDNLEDLRHLDLGNNSLSSLPEFVFANLTSLERLSLADNEIRVFANTFVGLNNLKTLNISKNPLRHLRESYFFGLTRSSDILTLGDEFWSMSTELFENPFLRDERLAQELAKRKAEKKIAAASDEETSEPVSAAPVANESLRFEICIRNGSVRLLDVSRSDGTLGSDCREAKIDRENGVLSLRSLGIERFESGWYRPRGLPVRTIGLEENDIVGVTSELLNDLPEEVTYVILSDNKIERLERGTISNGNLRQLNLKGNRISDIEDGALEKTKLTGLYVVDNRLRSTKFAATLPSTLTVLSLAGNRITEVTADSFAKLDKLEYVSLGGNGIAELKSRSLRGLSSLQMLPLDNNGLRRIEPGAFRDLGSLRTLSLNNNSLDSLEKGVFAGLGRIERIYAIRNKLTNLTRDSLEGLPETLKELHLQFNDIENLTAGTFVNVPGRTLSLTGNKISKIERGSFDLPTLHELSLSDNLLRELDGDSFEGLGGLRHLRLNGNDIARIERGATKNLGGLHILDISKNPIRRLENGAFFGLQRSRGSHVMMADVPVELIQGGLFEDAGRESD